MRTVSVKRKTGWEDLTGREGDIVTAGFIAGASGTCFLMGIVAGLSHKPWGLVIFWGLSIALQLLSRDVINRLPANHE